MYLEQISEHEANLISYHNDYGVPVNFSARHDDGFFTDDKIVFCVEDNIIAPIEWTVSGANYTFSLALTETDAAKLKVGKYKYAFKQYRDGKYRDTVMNGYIDIRETVLWQQD